jgi:hypothetical protein
MNGRIHVEFKDPNLSPRELIEHRLSLLDGVDRYSLSLWKLPEKVPLDRVNLDAWPQEYVQVAGSAARMTVEVRRAEQAGWGHYVLGRASRDPSVRPIEIVIPWNGYEARVFSPEVFTAMEAADVFAHYYECGEVAGTLSLRPLTVAQ